MICLTPFHLKSDLLFVGVYLKDDYVEALGRLHLTVSRAFRVNPDINFEVFIHKVDGLSDDHKIETQRDIHQRANDDLADASLEKLHLRFGSPSSVSSICRTFLNIQSCIVGLLIKIAS